MSGAPANDNELKLLKQTEQIRLRPDMYIGATAPELYEGIFHTTDGPKFIKADMTPGLLKIIGEVVDNAVDASQNDDSAKAIKFEFDKENSYITITSQTRFKINFIEQGDERGWSIAFALGRFLTGTNYGDKKGDYRAGRNGFGAKLTNLFSKDFIAKVTDAESKKFYHGEWKNNMEQFPVNYVKSTNKKTNSVEITFLPDFKSFGLPKKLSEDQWDIISSLAFNMAVTSPYQNIFINDFKVPFKGVKGYMKALLGDDEGKIAYDTVVDGDGMTGTTVFEVGVALARENPSSLIFCNGAATTKGPIHTYVLQKISEALSKKTSIPAGVLAGMVLIVGKALIPGEVLQFSSQSKTECTTAVSKFKWRWVPTSNFVKQLAQTGVFQKLQNIVQDKEDKKAIKDMKVGRNTIPNIAKYEPASLLFKKPCTLFLTEGDSAKALAMSGRAAVNAKDQGIFALQGKLMNTSKFSKKAVAANKEVKNVLQITGLEVGKKYTLETAKKLPYRNIMIFADQDLDGSHIAGLIIQLFENLVPSIFDVYPDFIQRFSTPILKVMSGPFKNKAFFTEVEFNMFLDSNPSAKNALIKYYKGLGTSTAKDAKHYFEEIVKNTTVLTHLTSADSEAIDLFFNEKRADDRKAFLTNTYVPDAYVDYSKSKTSIANFFKNDMAHFSWADNIRSIPKMIDGLVEGRRKIMFYTLSESKFKELKVAQLGSLVAEKTNYRHGEASLSSTIVNMAASFTGCSNLQFLHPEGQFGARAAKDSDASPRYIYTHLSQVAPLVFKDSDNAILDYNVEENKQVEPSNYVPVIPTVLTNGASGIGSGWKTDLPCYNPLEVIDSCMTVADGGVVDMDKEWVPFYLGFTGGFEKALGGFTCYGKAQLYDSHIVITELPVGVFVQQWQESISDLIPDVISKIEKNNGSNSINMKVFCKLPPNEVLAKLKLTKKINFLPNLFDMNGKIKLYTNLNQIIKEHSHVRLDTYEKSRKHQISVNEAYVSKLDNKIRYINAVLSGSIQIGKLTSAELTNFLFKNSYLKVNNSYTYLTSITTGQLTTDNVQKLLSEIDGAMADVSALKATTSHKMWKEDLVLLKDEVNSYFEARLREFDDSGAVGAKKKVKK